jgi:hypothetical protein
MRPADDDLERFVDDALRALPARRAPRTLLPRVIAATAEIRPRPWYTRTWLTWPAGWQVASVAAFVMLTGGVAWLWPAAVTLIGSAASQAGPVADRLLHIFQQIEVVPVLVRVFWRALLQPVAVIVFAVSVIGVLTSAVCWNTISRLALTEGPAHP